MAKEKTLIYVANNLIECKTSSLADL